MTLTIFYDGGCPLCLKEMQHLKKRDKQHNIILEDIFAPDFSERFPQFEVEKLDQKIHGMLQDGTILTGLDVTHKAWSLVGYPWLYAPLRWPVLRFFADKVYLLFAKHRHKISYWLTGKKRCDDNCGVKY